MSNPPDLRNAERFVMNETVIGSYSATEITVLNIGDRGVKIAHAFPLRIGTAGRLWFKRGEIAVSTHGRVVWSHLSKMPDASGKLLYHSGIRIDDEQDAELTAALQALLEAGVVRRDTSSLDRKREALEAKQRVRQNRPTLKILHPEIDVPPEQALLIQQVRDRLRANPEEAAKWYQRAKFAAPDVAAESLRQREDVLAVWEYLERSVALSMIVRVFERG